MTTTPVMDRLFRRLRWEGDCLVYDGARDPKGYGRIWSGVGMGAVHRTVYAETIGEIPDGLMVRHSCNNPPCCNPEHLSTGTALDNARDYQDYCHTQAFRARLHDGGVRKT